MRAEWIGPIIDSPNRLPVLATAAMSDKPFCESELVESSRKGEMWAYEALHREYVSRIYGLCLRMVSDPSRAEELTQDAFVRAWVKLSSFRGTSSFYTWLHRIAVNLSLGHLRSKKLWADRLRPVDSEVLEKRPESVHADPLTTLDLESAIATLPASARAVFVLHDVEGYKHREIAELLGIATGTSKAQLHRARLSLRKALRQ